MYHFVTSAKRTNEKVNCRPNNAMGLMGCPRRVCACRADWKRSRSPQCGSEHILGPLGLSIMDPGVTHIPRENHGSSRGARRESDAVDRRPVEAGDYDLLEHDRDPPIFRIGADDSGRESAHA